MKDRFFSLCERLDLELLAGEVLLCSLSGERSDFVRFNQGRVRQAGSVEQGWLSLRLIRARRQAYATVTATAPEEEIKSTLRQLRETLAGLPEDPWLLINETPQSTTSERRGELADAKQVAATVMEKGKGLDLVGFYAGGTICRGFASSLGQRNWHEVDSFNFDWSLYLEADRAVKSGHAGFRWEERALEEKIDAAARALELLRRPQRTIEPGEYRAYIAPRALEDLAGMLSWGGFSARELETKQSPLLRLREGAALSPKVTMLENAAEGMAPGFQGDGFVKPPRVTLIENGRLKDPLVSPRSAKEYGLATNAAGAYESPQSLDVAAGSLEESQALQALEDGLYINNLWYLNYSDRPAGRITGMTRFATFQVERGRIAAPVTPMRFDDSIYRMLGENLVDFTRGRELLPDPSTYGERSTSSMRLPGALLKAMRFTL